MGRSIQCGDHRQAPYSIVCIHLINGTSKEWLDLPVEEGSEVDHDWVCPDCCAKLEEGIVDMVPLLRPVCMHCVRKLRAER